MLLTSAHVVRATAVDIRVRQHGSTVRYPAAVTVYAPDCDLALLEIRGEKESAEFWGVSTSTASTTSAAATLNDGDNDDDDNNGNDSSSLALELADRLPALRESVHVVGYPTGGTTICITEGIVSRIDMVSASAFNNVLAIQIDAAINVSVNYIMEYLRVLRCVVPRIFHLNSHKVVQKKPARQQRRSRL